MFSINGSRSIVIYGAATSGKIVYDILKKNQIDIIALKERMSLANCTGKELLAPSMI